MENHVLSLSDGRTLGFGDYGNKDGLPVLLFHGTPSSRVHPFIQLLEEMAKEMPFPPIRIIAIERPGYGLSTPKQGRTIENVVTDTKLLLRYLKIDQFSTIGISGGAPYALACAADMPDRVQKVAVISGMGPLHVRELLLSHSKEDQIGFLSAFQSPDGLRKFVQYAQKNPEAFVKSQYDQLHASEKKNMTKEILNIYTKTISEATRTPWGMIDDYKNFLTPWPFDPATLKTFVKLWHSDEDDSVPVNHARHMHRVIPNSEYTELKGLSHLASIFAPLPEVLEFLTMRQVNESSNLENG
ncbi:alpha/beta fold hydrolase [Fictibacillus iocasae]|uniref:Alpha/beta fold hydrolase n=1 Tax=Fictibacillus iocasae TaxID=2715437 RepID=A0ABW2NPH4_9BACL